MEDRRVQQLLYHDNFALSAIDTEHSSDIIRLRGLDELEHAKGNLNLKHHFRGKGLRALLVQKTWLYRNIWPNSISE